VLDTGALLVRARWQTVERLSARGWLDMNRENQDGERMGRTMLALADGSITTSAMLNTPVVGHAQHESMKQSMFAMTVVEASVARISRRTALAGAGSIALVLLGASACGFPRPADVSGDAAVDVPGGTDGSAGPIVAIHVSPSGDDSNDGLVSPVKTLKHAIGLAADNTQISQIILATGTYSVSSGETFPYAVPPNVTIAGPAGGGALLAGDKAGPGMTVDIGGLQDLDFQDFATAITARGTASLKNIRVLTSTTAVQAETAASLTVKNLDLTGTVAACATGIVLNGNASLTVSTFTARALGTSLVVAARAECGRSTRARLGGWRWTSADRRRSWARHMLEASGDGRSVPGSS
jgi:hypothetical protein